MNIQTKRWARPLALFIAMTMVVMYSFGGVAFADNDNSPKAGVESESRGGHDNENGKSNGFALGHDKKDGLPEGDDDSKTEEGSSDSEGGDDSEQQDDGGNNLNPGFLNPMIQMVQQQVVQLEKAYVRVHFHGTANSGIEVTTVINGVTYTAIAAPANGMNYEGFFEIENASSFKGKLNKINTTLKNISSGATIEIKNISAKGKNGWINITTGKETEVVVIYDLGIEKTSNLSSIEVGQPVTFTVKVTNYSEVTVNNVTVNDTWPDQFLEFVTATGVYNTSLQTWTIEEIGPDEEVTLYITGKGIAAGSAVNVVNVTFAGIDVDASDNTSQSTVQVNAKPLVVTTDAGILKEVSSNSVTAGSMVTFNIVVSNNSTVTMTGLEVIDQWPETLTLVEITAPEGTAFTTGSSITWSAGDLDPGQSKTLTIKALTTTAGPITNTAIINYGDGPGDSNPDNDTDSVNINVTAPANNEEDDDDDTPGGGGGGTGGGGGGGTTIQETTPPLTNIPDGETPLVEAPEVMLEEQPIPLADVPQTGDNTNIWLLLALMMGSGAGIVLLGRRKETVEK